MRRLLVSSSILLILLALLLLPYDHKAGAQVPAQVTGAGAPSGSCTSTQSYLDTTAHNIYNCNNGVWQLQGQLPGAQSSGSGLPTGLTYVAPTLTVSAAGAGNAVVALSGNTSGTATFTSPAVAGTVLNPIAISNVITTPAGGTSVPNLAPSNDTGTGWSLPGIGEAWFLSGGSIILGIMADGGSFEVGSGMSYQWANGANPHTGAPDTGISRDAAGVVDIGTGAQGNKTGQLNAGVFNPTATTVAALPAAAAGNKGWMKTVSDSTAVSTEGQTCAGGGAITALAFSNGTVWKCF